MLNRIGFPESNFLLQKSTFWVQIAFILPPAVEGTSRIANHPCRPP
jgi:hypothetical protein